MYNIIKKKKPHAKLLYRFFGMTIMSKCFQGRRTNYNMS